MGKVWVWVLRVGGGALVSAACSTSVEPPPPTTQSCLTAFGCFEAADPAAYDITLDCKAIEGRLLGEACDASRYDIQCTERFISEVGGKEREVSLVYYWSRDSELICLGEQARL